MAKAVTGTVLDDWAEIASATLREGAADDISGFYAPGFMIQVAPDGTGSIDGVEVVVQISHAASGDGTWIDWNRFVAASDTHESSGLVTPASGNTLTLATQIAAATDIGKWIFIEDSGAVTNSEMGVIKAISGDCIVLVDDLTSAKDSSDNVFGWPSSTPVALPQWAMRARVLYNNAYDTTPIGYFSRTLTGEMTSV